MSGYRQNLEGLLQDYALKKCTVLSGAAEELSVECQKYLKAKARVKSIL